MIQLNLQEMQGWSLRQGTDGFLTYINRHAQRSKESCDMQIVRRKLRRIFFHLFPCIFKEDLLLCGSRGCCGIVFGLFFFALAATWPAGVKVTSRYVVLKKHPPTSGKVWHSHTWAHHGKCSASQPLA